MDTTNKLTRVEATPELLSEMEMLQIYGGDVIINPNHADPCGNMYVFCQEADCGNCGNCDENCGTNCTFTCNTFSTSNCYTYCNLVCMTYTTLSCYGK